MKIKLLGYYNYTVLMTYLGMLSGFLGIVCVLDGYLRASLICLMAAGVCDMFDGAIASTKKRDADEKCFGIQIDSLSDLICFGVLPAVIVSAVNEHSDIAYVFSGFYVLCALIRLAYFNVDEQNRQKETSERRKYYLGLPVTTSAIIFPLLFAICNYTNIRRDISSIATITVTGILFVCPFKLKKPEIIGKIALAICGILEFVFLIAGVGDV